MQISNLDISIKTTTNNSLDKAQLNNNNLEYSNFWNRKSPDMPMLLQKPAQILLSGHETDQPLDFTMSKFKTKTSNTVASQLKQINNTIQQQTVQKLFNNGYYGSKNNNKSFGASSPSSSEEDVGPPGSTPSSPGPLRDGKKLTHNHYNPFNNSHPQHNHRSCY